MPLPRRPPGPPPEARSGRVPPGQVLTRKWPVLHHGEVPRMDPATWDLQVYGEVEEELRFGWEEWLALPTEERTGDIHCVTRWSRLDNRWRGVPVRELLRRARPRSTARFVLLRASGGWTTNLPLEDFDRDENLLATHHDGEPLSPEHGGPLRAVIPHLYFWKSAKWVRAVELLAEDRPGFWEINGYHLRGDPWKSERFGDPALDDRPAPAPDGGQAPDDAGRPHRDLPAGRPPRTACSLLPLYFRIPALSHSRTHSLPSSASSGATGK